MSECVRARASMAGFVDCDLEGDESDWLRAHVDGCAECRVALAGFVEMDRKLNAWGEGMAREHPAPAGERERLSLRLGQPRVRRRIPLRVRTCAWAFVAAAGVLLAIIPQVRAPVTNRASDRAEFVAIPYLAPVDARENATIVRMDIRVAMLLAAGYRIMGDPDAVVSADVLVGEDGRAHAVRVISDVDLKGTGH
jgi:anti-sigma factor RsiW